MEEIIEKVDEITSNKNLKNTIELDDGFYNINAVYSDEAGKVTTPLLIRQSGDVGSEVEFDGSVLRNVETGEVLNDENGKPARHIIDYVPTTGGEFTGPVQIYKNSEAVSGIGKSEIINYGQVEALIKNLKGAPLWKWNKNDGYTSINNPNTSAPYMLNTIIGSETDFQYLVQALEGIQSEYASDSWPITCSYTGESSELKEYLTQLKPEYYEDSTVVIRGKIKYTSDDDRPTAIGFGIDYDTLVITPFMTATSTTGVENKVDTVYILPGAKEIRSLAFSGCINLKKIFIPGSVELIASDAFNGSGLTDIYYTGTEAEWSRIKGYHYEFTDNADTGEKSASVKFEDIHPLDSLTGVTRHFVPLLFLYICKEAGETDTSLTSNKMFLKLPGEKAVEISKGAVRLNSAALNSTDYYTYEGLAEIIARINKRLAALGGEEYSVLALDPNKTSAPVYTVEQLKESGIIAEDTVDDIDVPSLKELEDKINSVTLDETTVKLKEDLYTYAPIGNAQKASNKVIGSGNTISANNPGKLGTGGESSLKDVFNVIFGTETPIQPSVNKNISLSVTCDKNSYTNSKEVGTVVSESDETATYTISLSNSATVSYGYRIGNNDTTGSQTVYYPAIKAYNDNTAQVKITLPSNNTGNTKITIQSGELVNPNTTGNILYCNFKDSKTISFSVTLPKASYTNSLQTRYDRVVAEVTLGDAQIDNTSNASVTNDDTKKINAFLAHKPISDIYEASTVSINGGAQTGNKSAITISAGYVPYSWELATGAVSENNSLPSEKKRQYAYTSITITDADGTKKLYIYTPSDKSITDIKNNNQAAPFTCVDDSRNLKVNGQSNTFKIYCVNAPVASGTNNFTITY